MSDRSEPPTGIRKGPRGRRGIALIAGLALALTAGAQDARPETGQEKDQEEKPMTGTPPSAFDLEEVSRRLKTGAPAWVEFLTEATLRVGLYALPRGAADPQPPHQEDEVYYVVRGKAVLRVGGEAIPVRPGSVVFVRAEAEHRFEAIEEDLQVLVFFSRTPAR
jgi:mannose-6-phosphate isomerase-like protein (cupin superfamily)